MYTDYHTTIISLFLILKFLFLSQRINYFSINLYEASLILNFLFFLNFIYEKK